MGFKNLIIWVDELLTVKNTVIISIKSESSFDICPGAIIQLSSQHNSAVMVLHKQAAVTPETEKEIELHIRW